MEVHKEGSSMDKHISSIGHNLEARCLDLKSKSAKQWMHAPRFHFEESGRRGRRGVVDVDFATLHGDWERSNSTFLYIQNAIVALNAACLKHTPSSAAFLRIVQDWYASRLIGAPSPQVPSPREPLPHVSSHASISGTYRESCTDEWR